MKLNCLLSSFLVLYIVFSDVCVMVVVVLLIMYFFIVISLTNDKRQFSA